MLRRFSASERWVAETRTPSLRWKSSRGSRRLGGCAPDTATWPRASVTGGDGPCDSHRAAPSCARGGGVCWRTVTCPPSPVPRGKANADSRTVKGLRGGVVVTLGRRCRCPTRTQSAGRRRPVLASLGRTVTPAPDPPGGALHGRGCPRRPHRGTSQACGPSLCRGFPGPPTSAAWAPSTRVLGAFPGGSHSTPLPVASGGRPAVPVRPASQF